MLNFQKLERSRLPRLQSYFRGQERRISNYSAGSFFLWGKYADTHFAEAEGCLLLRDRYVGQPYFYYPLSKDGDAAAEERALGLLEEHCRAAEERLHFTCVPAEKLAPLAERYGDDLHISNIRRWRDYLYEASDFRDYPGGRYSGQRNHVHKFEKTYPDHAFRTCEAEDLPAIEAFLREYAASQYAKESALADEEMRGAFEILPHIAELGLYCGALYAGGKMVALSVGERCGDMMIVHIEKALRGVAGAYPAVAQAFARTFCADGVRYINREDDAGDAGLRKSKLQYLPVRLVGKYNLAVHRAIDSLSKLPSVQTARLTLRAVPDEDAAAFAALARDEELNRWWGYNWRDRAPAEPDDMWFLEDIRSDFRRKSEIPLGIYCGDTLAGEVVLHNFGYRAEAEIGMRVLPAWQRRGIAREALLGMMEYGFLKLGLERIEAKCFRENAVSARALRAAGMRPCGEDATYFYFYKTAAM